MTVSSLLIRQLHARPVIAPLPRPLRTAMGVIPAAPLVLVDIETSAGITGSAYLFGYATSALGALARLLTDIGQELTGLPAMPADITRHVEKRFRLLGLQGLVGMAASAIDLALWDIVGKAQGVSIAEMLGAKPRPLPAYDSYGVIDIQRDAKALQDTLATGFRAIKIKLGDGDLKHDCDTLAAVRSIIGPDIALMVDYNQSLSLPEARRRIDAIARFDLTWVEEPLPAEDLAGHASLRMRTHIPIQTGENWWYPPGAMAALSAGACDHAMLDLIKIGGVTGWMASAAIAAQHGIPISSHLFQEASAHVLAATPMALWLEHLDIAGSLLVDPPRIENGALTAKGPGLGIVWHEDAIARLT